MFFQEARVRGERAVDLEVPSLHSLGDRDFPGPVQERDRSQVTQIRSNRISATRIRRGFRRLRGAGARHARGPIAFLHEPRGCPSGGNLPIHFPPLPGHRPPSEIAMGQSVFAGCDGEVRTQRLIPGGDRSKRQQEPLRRVPQPPRRRSTPFAELVMQAREGDRGRRRCQAIQLRGQIFQPEGRDLHRFRLERRSTAAEAAPRTQYPLEVRMGLVRGSERSRRRVVGP
jgi:hypothetical protein